MIKLALTIWYNFKYRRIAYNETCCCGEAMDTHSYSSGHSPVCEKLYAVESAVERRLKQFSF
jgi:hypothetical protein